MNRVFYLITLCLTLSLLSCEKINNFFSEEETETAPTYSSDTKQDTNTSVEVSVDSVKNSVANIEGDLKTQGEQIQDLTNQLNKAKEDINQAKDDLSSKLSSRELMVVCVINLLLSILVLWILSRKLGLSKKDVEEIVRKNVKSTANSWSVYQNSTKNNQIIELSNRLNEIEQDLRKTKDSIKQFMTNTASGPSPTSYAHPQQPFSGSYGGVKPTSSPTNNQPQRFFLPKPCEERLFIDSQKSINQSEDYFYEFTLDKKNPRKATFVFKPFNINRQSFAHDYSPQIIHPVCDLKDNGTSTFECIKGEAELKEGKWYVTKKANVIFR